MPRRFVAVSLLVFLAVAARCAWPGAIEDAPYNASIAGLASDPDPGDILTFSKVSGPAWLSVASKGALSGTPANSDVGVNRFVVKVSDNLGAYSQASMIVTVINVNDPPVFAASSFTKPDATEDVAYAGTIADKASDPDVGDTLRFSKVGGPAWLSVAANGALSGTPANANVGANTFTVRVKDAAGASADATLSIKVINTNDPPSFAASSFTKPDATEDAAYSGTIADKASDPDVGDTLTFSKVGGPSWMSVAANGALSGTPANANVGANTFTVRVKDTAGASADATLSIKVVNTNDPPSFAASSFTKPDATEDVAYSGTIADKASDPDVGDTLTFSKVGGPSWLSVAANGALSGTPANANVGANTFTVRVKDAAGASADATLSITVINVNDPPKFANAIITRPQATVGLAYVDSLAGEATDPDAFDTLTYRKTSGPAWLNVASRGDLSGAPGVSDIGECAWTIQADDGHGATAQATLKIQVAPQNRLELGVKTSVGGSWTSVTLQSIFVKPVVVCSVNYCNNAIPVLVRVRNASSKYFDVRIQNPANKTVQPETVHYMVVEEGKWLLPNGVAIEAYRFNSTVTDNTQSWGGQPYAYSRIYTSPVVLGQVVTFNDPFWSAFWSCGSDSANPPSTSACKVGKHVGKDPDSIRFAETLGVVVIESFSGAIDGAYVTAALGSDKVKGVSDTSTGYTYTLSGFSAAPAGAIVTQAGMDGTDGSWACLYGATPLRSTSIVLAVDEDAITTESRVHSTEQVGYLVFEKPTFIPLTKQ